MFSFTRISIYALALLLLGCGDGPDKTPRNDAFSSSVVKQDASCLQIPPTVPSVSLSGKIEYERVPVKVNFVQHGLVQSQLSPSDITKHPAKGIKVQALSCTGDVVSETITDAQGVYTLPLSNIAQARIRVIAVLERKGSSVIDSDASNTSNTDTSNVANNTTWSVTIRDNTRSGEPIYAELTDLINLNQAVMTRDILMSSGWGGVSFDQRRQSAPFAIAATIYQAMDYLTQQGVVLNYPPLTIYWSAKNRSVNRTDIRRGELATSFYRNGAIYLLGHILTDSDDMDQHVITHEWGHYLEDKFSRSDSLGGAHSIRSRLDPRVSFSEGFGNAMSALLLEDAKYRDALGSEVQFLGGGFDLETDEIQSSPSVKGWYSEHRVQSMLYDLHDGKTEDEDEEVELALSRLFSVMMQGHKSTPAFTTMVSFVDTLLKQAPDQKDIIVPLLEHHEMDFLSDTWGSNSVTLGDLVADSNAPLYTVISEGKTRVCLSSNEQAYNGVATRRFYRFIKGRAGQAVINIAGPEGSSPSFRVWKAGVQVVEALSRSSNVRRIFNLDAGEFVLEVTDFRVLNGKSLAVTDCYTMNLILN